MTIEQKIELLEKMAKDKFSLAKYFHEKGDEENANEYYQQCFTMYDCLDILKKDTYAEKIANIYNR